jgi:hypothetical protein
MWRGSVASTVSTALDLLRDSQGLYSSGSGRDADRQLVPDTLTPSSDEGASTSCDSGQADSADTVHSIIRTAEQAGRSSNPHENVDELWTHGVDPADVEIHMDAHGQPVVLGKGACAVVYLGRWHASLVAVKVMLSEIAQDELRAEADILRGLRHPNVVLLMAVCIAPNQQVQCAH